MRVDDLGRAVALVGARLRGDGEGERVLLGDCDECRPLAEGLLLVAETALTVMADRDHVSREQAAETTAALLRGLLGEGRA